MEGDFIGFLIQNLKSCYLNVRGYFRIFRLDDKLYWMKGILVAVIVSMIQLNYEYVDADKKKFFQTRPYFLLSLAKTTDKFHYPLIQHPLKDHQLSLVSFCLSSRIPQKMIQFLEP